MFRFSDDRKTTQPKHITKQNKQPSQEEEEVEEEEEEEEEEEQQQQQQQQQTKRKQKQTNTTQCYTSVINQAELIVTNSNT